MSPSHPAASGAMPVSRPSTRRVPALASSRKGPSPPATAASLFVGPESELPSIEGEVSTAAADGSRRGSSTATRISSMAATARTSSSCASPAPPTRRSRPPAAASSRPCGRPATQARTTSSPPPSPRLDALIAEGVTTVEVKSGYGLELESELRMLRAARRLAKVRPVGIVTTLLGAHAVPPGMARDDYVDLVCARMIPAAAQAGLADAVDAFCEGIAFTVEETARVFTAARAPGFPFASMQSSSRGRAARPSPLASARCRPTMSNMPRTRMRLPWRGPARWRCSCPGVPHSARDEASSGRGAFAAIASPWPCRPTPTPAPPLSPRFSSR